MKSPIDTVKGRIVGYDERTGDVLIRARYEDYFTLCKREYKSCLVQLVDSRTLSDRPVSYTHLTLPTILRV